MLRTIALFVLLALVPGLAFASQCPAERPMPLVPADAALCAALDRDMRRPGAFPLDVYQEKLGRYLGAFCHRNLAAGWRVDKMVRDTGPFTATLRNDKTSGNYHGTHAPVVIWYSPEMFGWLKANRTQAHEGTTEPPVPDGAMMIKEMFPAPAALCRDVDPLRLLPTSGAAVMVRDAKASHDGWFWGWFGWSDWKPDWPAGPGNGYPNMGFGQYCVNCHASAKANATFADLKNIKGEPGRPLVFLSQNAFTDRSAQAHDDLSAMLNHLRIVQESDDITLLGAPARESPAPEFTTFYGIPFPHPTADKVMRMPSQTYDVVWASANRREAQQQFLTSDQCLGCHDAGSTGLHFDMTLPGPDGRFLNLSPYGTWSSSPMGLAGRDPVFFAQLASETETFHPEAAELVQDTCLGCHGVMGQRQLKIDEKATGKGCSSFSRAAVAATPWPAGHSGLEARHGALARDGVSCTTCHAMALSEAERSRVKAQPQNSCVEERQERLNPENTGFARTFTGSFLMGAMTEMKGPFEGPKAKPMENALGMTPVQNPAIKSSEVCGSCHTVHLPVLDKGKVIGHTYEQTTYAEWAFSDFRTGHSPDGALPFGAGKSPETCQGCHMPSRDADGHPYRSKIASIQEYSNFPQAEHTLPPEEIDLPVRSGFASHVLVGLNSFLIKMAQQFPELMGIRTQDPMLTKKGVDPLLFTEKAIDHQAAERTAAIAVESVRMTESALEASVRVTNKTGHKFPSGVGFRRAFIALKVLDAGGRTIWASGRTDALGVITDGTGAPVAGEVWWNGDCSARLDPLAHQPHREVITRQDQVQIYQELVSSPPLSGPAQCGIGSQPAGQLTTSFLSICSNVKDNRLLPRGYLGRDDRVKLAASLGAGPELADEAGPVQVGDDPDYREGGGDATLYRIALPEIDGKPAAIEATLFYQAMPPFYLQDRFCTSKSEDTKRLHFMAGRLNLAGSRSEGWKLRTVTTGAVTIAGGAQRQD